jgi:hypothetical protein
MTLMNKNNTVNDLADLLVKLGTKKNGSEHGLNYCWAYGTLTALFDQARWGHASIQDLIDNKIAEVEKDLAAA